MKISVASGKGGVGKSMVASALAILFSRERKVVAVDCDVDAPNLGLWLGIEDEWDERRKITTSEKATIDYSKCTLCGKCKGVCSFNALIYREKPEILPYLCEGCSLCVHVCPENAIDLNPTCSGEVRVKKTRYGFTLVSGLLYPGETGSGKIVVDVKRKAEQIGYDVMIIDSAAGIGCPVISSIRGTDYSVLVTEPTPTGLSDLKRVLQVVEMFSIPYFVVINKYDINPSLSRYIEKWSGSNFIGEISFDKKVFESISNLKPVLESKSIVVDEIKKIYLKLKEKIRL